MGRTMFLERCEGRIGFTDEGRGPLVLMVPGIGDLKEEYRFLVPQLLAAQYRCVTVDLRGMGASSAVWPSYSNVAIGSDIVALLEHLVARDATVIGTSMGAGAAAWAAAEMPLQIRQLVLIGPFVREPRNAATLRGRLMRLMMSVAFSGPWARAAWGGYWSSLFPSRKPEDFGRYKARLLASLREPGRMTALRAMLEAPKRDVERRLHAIRARTLVVMGSKDPDFPDPAREAGDIAGLLHGRVLMIDGAGHYPQAEMPEVTGKGILHFLQNDGG